MKPRDSSLHGVSADITSASGEASGMSTWLASTAARSAGNSGSDADALSLPVRHLYYGLVKQDRQPTFRGPIPPPDATDRAGGDGCPGLDAHSVVGATRTLVRSDEALATAESAAEVDLSKGAQGRSNAQLTKFRKRDWIFLSIVENTWIRLYGVDSSDARKCSGQILFTMTLNTPLSTYIRFPMNLSFLRKIISRHRLT